VRALVFLLATTLTLGLAYGRHGLHGADGGFITALAWRIHLGQVPYRDFIYIRPPLSPLLHALTQGLLPAGYEMIGERFLFYFFVAAYSWISTAVLDRLWGLRERGLRPWALALLFVAGSVGNFPPMPWHTVDGILFGAIAILALSCGTGPFSLVLGALAVLLACLCKQSFFFMAPLATAYVAIVRGRRELLRFAGALAALAAACVAGLAYAGVLAEFSAQLSGQTRARSLLHAGVFSYFRHYYPSLALGLLGYVVIDRVRLWRSGRGVRAAWLPYAVLGSMIGGAALYGLARQRFQTPLHNWHAFLFLVTLVGLLYGRGARGKPAWTLALMLGLAWCGSLSWGYPSPALYSAPLLFGALLYAQTYLGTRPGPLSLYLLALALTAQLAGYQFPYREPARAELSWQLGEVFEKLDGIHVTRETERTYRELARLRAQYGPTFAVLPDMPLAHYLTGTMPSLPVDWAVNSESNDRADRLIGELERARPVVFLRRDSPALCAVGALCSPVALHVREHWRLVERGEFLDVYRAAL
jgi:hypothetical protein